VIAFFATLFLIPGSHELATPGPVSIPLPGPDHIHLRWKSLRSSGYWEPPTLKLPFAGTYWVSAATKSKVRTIPAATFNQLVINDGLTMVQQYRKQYKQLNEPGRIVTSDYAKTMITVGPPEPIAPVELNLPVEFILRYPQLVQLNFRGQPIEGIQISLNGKPIGITNGAGQLPLPVLNFSAKLTATVVRAYPDPGTAPWEFFNASLTLPPLSQRQAAFGRNEQVMYNAKSSYGRTKTISCFLPVPFAPTSKAASAKLSSYFPALPFENPYGSLGTPSKFSSSLPLPFLSQ
jgi:hypothetical protein